MGAEVVLDGTVWAVVRAIGHRRRDLAVEGGDLDGLAAGTEPAPGLDAFLDAVEERLITAPVAALVPGGHPRRAWLSALAWLARDQECRFDHVLAWRSAASGSDRGSGPIPQGPGGAPRESTFDDLFGATPIY
ncbi:MAG: hypothetical protein ABIO70_34650 [Pseudomonadota bacterium]